MQRDFAAARNRLRKYVPTQTGFKPGKREFSDARLGLRKRVSANEGCSCIFGRQTVTTRKYASTAADAREFLENNFSKQKLLVIAACLGIPFSYRDDKAGIADAIERHRPDLLQPDAWPAVKGLLQQMTITNNYNFDLVRSILGNGLATDVEFWSVLLGTRPKYLYEREWQDYRDEAGDLLHVNVDQLSDSQVRKVRDDIAQFEHRGRRLLIRTHMRHYKRQ